MSNKNNVLIVFIRNTQLGKVKTRLAQGIGAQNALEVYQHLLKHTSNICKELSCDKIIFFSEEKVPHKNWKQENMQLALQSGHDLGERMSQAFEEVFKKGYQKAIIIGSDCFALKAKHIEQAFNILEQKEVAIGPAFDGGYYLLGMKKNHRYLFENKEWSSETVLKDTLSNLEERQISFQKLERLNDIDTVEDLKKHSQFNSYTKA